MSQTHSTRQAVRPGTAVRHGNHRKEGQGPRRSTPGNHARIPAPGLRVVAAPGGVAFVKESSVD
jgi:hypothetical protein